MMVISNTNQPVTRAYDANCQDILRKVEGTPHLGGYGGILEWNEVYSGDPPYEINKKKFNV